MKYTVCKSIIQVIGKIWLPPIQAGTTYTLDRYQIDNCRDDQGQITRESVEHWLCLNSGDFQSVIDFHASIEDGPNTIDIPWAKEDSEFEFYDCTCPQED